MPTIMMTTTAASGKNRQRLQHQKQRHSLVSSPKSIGLTISIASFLNRVCRAPNMLPDSGASLLIRQRNERFAGAYFCLVVLSF
jgi:hypothetical protein